MPTVERRKNFAENTTVAAERTKSDIRKLVTAAGAQGWRAGEDEDRGQAVIEFRLPAAPPHTYSVRIRIHLPIPALDEFRLDGRGRTRTATAQAEAYGQEIRRRWRALHLSLKAKLVAVQEGIFTVEDEFEPHIVIPGTNRTMREHTRHQLQKSLETNTPPSSLPMLPPSTEGDLQ